MIESVIATVEVKSTLTSDELNSAVKAARNAKSLTPNTVSSFYSGYLPPKVLNYIVAYDGPAHMSTVHGWLAPIFTNLGVPQDLLPQDEQQRISTPSQSIDGVFVLQKGFMYFDNVPMGFANANARAQIPDMKWVWADSQSGNLLLLFLFLQTATANIEGRWLNTSPYLSSFVIEGIQAGT